jgi:cysteinyl-tRNA synthetase, unknown class
MRKKIAALVRSVATAAALCGAIAPALAAREPAEARRAKLSGVQSWHYQLQRADLDTLAASHADLLVIDYAAGRPQKPLSRADVTRLQTKPNGGRRVVLAYLSIGEAEEYRFYWRPEWIAARPAWLVSENCNWPQNHLVRYWHQDWKAIVMSGQNSYLGRIQDAGFDGVYLDLVDAYESLQTERKDSRAAMISFVTELAKTARQREPEFLIFPQNADELLTDKAYRQLIDGIGREGLIFRAEQGRRRPERVRSSVDRLQLLRSAGKPVLVVEYVTTPGDAAAVRDELSGHGFVPVVATRALDGRDPLAPPLLKRPPVVVTVPPAVTAQADMSSAAVPAPARTCGTY